MDRVALRRWGAPTLDIYSNPRRERSVAYTTELPHARGYTSLACSSGGAVRAGGRTVPRDAWGSRGGGDVTTGAATTAQTPTTTPPLQICGLGAATWSHLFLRAASS